MSEEASTPSEGESPGRGGGVPLGGGGVPPRDVTAPLGDRRASQEDRRASEGDRRAPRRDDTGDDTKGEPDEGSERTDSVADTQGWETIILGDVAPARVPVVEATLILIAHPENKLLGKRYRLSPGQTIRVGRSSQAELSFPEIRSISRIHAQLEHCGERVTLEDMGSKNHTYLNDRRVERPTSMTSGDRFQVGSLHFKFLHELDVEHAYHDAIYDLGQRDGLTGIFNKRKFDEESERECNRAIRFGRPLTMVLIDLDKLKPINDTYGHLCGDQVIKQLALRVQAQLDHEHVFARLGGDEFGVLLPETDLQQGARLTEEIRKAVTREPFQCEEATVDVSCSFGVASLGSAMRSHQELYKVADDVLYEAKSGGRDRVCIHGQD